MSEKEHQDENPNLPPAPIILIAKMNRTISDGNYGNDRYEVPVPIEWTPGEPLEPLYAEAFAIARAQIEKEAAYDKRLRKLTGQYEHAHGETVQDWDALTEQYSADETLQPSHREWLLGRFAKHRAARVEQDEQERMKKERQVATVLAVIAKTQEYVAGNPVPEDEALWQDVQRGALPPYYRALHKLWEAEVPGYKALPHWTAAGLTRAPISAILGTELEEILKGNLPQMERPPVPPVTRAPMFEEDDDEEEWNEDLESVLPDNL